MSRFIKLFLFSFVLVFAMTMLACAPSIKLSKDWVMPGRTMDVKWNAPVKQQKSGAWIGVVDADTPADAEITHDKADMYYKTLDRKSSGKFELKVPGHQGDFELRIYDSEKNGKVLASARFTVSNTIKF